MSSTSMQPRERPLAAHRNAIEEICRRRHVRRLDLFGSAAIGRDRPGESDYDFLVEFEPMPGGGHADAYFGLIEDLAALLGRAIDLVSPSAIRNPYFRESVERSRVPVSTA